MTLYLKHCYLTYGLIIALPMSVKLYHCKNFLHQQISCTCVQNHVHVQAPKYGAVQLFNIFFLKFLISNSWRVFWLTSMSMENSLQNLKSKISKQWTMRPNGFMGTHLYNGYNWLHVVNDRSHPRFSKIKEMNCRKQRLSWIMKK